jgi:hypothetical protein
MNKNKEYRIGYIDGVEDAIAILNVEKYYSDDKKKKIIEEMVGRIVSGVGMRVGNKESEGK